MLKKKEVLCEGFPFRFQQAVRYALYTERALCTERANGTRFCVCVCRERGSTGSVILATETLLGRVRTERKGSWL